MLPSRRASVPTAWASAIQIAATPRASSLQVRRTGPGPLRTARGGTRVAPLDRDALALEVFLRPGDVGGVDVRVAMVARLRDRHMRHMHHTPPRGPRDSMNR